VISEIVRPEVFETVLSLALGISIEGKKGENLLEPFSSSEGMKTSSSTLTHGHQSFSGVSEEERNILDPRLKETVKEFSSIDGAFVFREDGVILAAGRHLDASGENIEIPLGLGVVTERLLALPA